MAPLKYPLIPGETKEQRRLRLNRESHKRNYDKDPEKAREQNRRAHHKWKQGEPEDVRRSLRRRQLRYNYGLDLDSYEKLVEQQQGVCKICGLPSPNRRDLSVDHCHETDTIRGLLCDNCNRGLGMFKDSPNLLRTAAEYLEYSFDPEKDLVCV